MKITFLGAAKTVTGSCYLIETEQQKFLVDCGMFQGKDMELRNLDPFMFDPSQLDFMILTHAHMDHTGLIPKLVRHGFDAPIYMTPPSSALAEILVMDAAKIQEDNADNKPKKNHYSEAMPQKLNVALYDSADALAATSMFRSISFHEEIKIDSDLSFRLVGAGHILGAASVVITYKGENIIFSGDLGRENQSIVKPFDLKELSKYSPKYIIMESLYGGVEHPERDDSIKDLYSAINDSIDRNGNVIIPSFAIHRTPEILEYLKIGFHEGYIKENVQVFLDSPMASRALKVYTSNIVYFNPGFEINGISYDYGMRKQQNPGVTTTTHFLQENRFKFDTLQYIRKHKQSLRSMKHTKSLYVAGSGMAEGGRVMHHLAANLSKPETGVLFVGYQAEDTLGRELVDGAKKVTINNKVIRVNADIRYIKGFSGHADNSDLLMWLQSFKLDKLKSVFLVHAEEERSLAFKDVLSQKNINGIIPDWKQTVILDI